MRKIAAYFLLSTLSTLCAARTLRVPQDYPTPQAAVDVSASGDTILISPGLYKVPGRPFTLANGRTALTGLALHDGTILLGSGPAQTVLDFKGAEFGVVVQTGTATVKLVQLRKARNMIFAYLGGVLTVKNVIAVNQPVGICSAGCSGIQGDQGISYTVYNSVLDKLPQSFGALGVAFSGSSDFQNNLVTRNKVGIAFGTYAPSGFSYNDVFHSTTWDWAYCESSCAPIDPLPTNVSFDPLYCPDYTLQGGSLANHAGSPAILNQDGTRSDMGAYGGPDAVQPPIIAVPCVVNFGKVAVGTTSEMTIQLFSTTGVDQPLQYLVRSGAPNFDQTGVLPTSISPSGSSLSFTFSPTTKKSYSGTVQVFTANPFPTTILLKGKGN